MKWIIGISLLAIGVLTYFCYQDHIEWIKYSKEFHCSETGKQQISTYIYFINVNNQMIPQQGINVSTQYYCEVNKQYVWR